MVNGFDKSAKDDPFHEFPFEEFSQRKQRAIELMEENGLDGLFLANQPNVYYYSCYRRTWTTNWPQCLVFTREGRMGLIVPQIMHEFSKAATWVEDEGIHPYGGSAYWGLPQDPIELISQTMKDLGLAEKTIGLELGAPVNPMLLPFADLETIKKALPKATFKDAVPMIWKQRLIKSPWEQETIRKLADISVKGYKRAIECARQGMTEIELLEICWHTFLQEGACNTPMEGDLMFRGGATDYAMSTPRQLDKPLVKGAQLFFDGGASYKGYFMDFQRQICFGESPDLQTRLVEISEEGQRAAEAMIKPGNRIKDVHAAAMSVIDHLPSDLKDQGVDFLYSHTFMGHCEGLGIHEPPWITAECEDVIQPGMVMALEIPALDIPQFRVLGGFPEDVYLVTEDGHEVLTGGIERKQYIIK